MTYLRNQEAMRILGITSEGTLPGWAKTNKIPCMQDDKRQVYPEAYIRRLAYFATGRKPTSEMLLFCMLEWHVHNGDTQERGRALDEIHKMQRRGEVYTTVEVAKRVGYDRHTVGRWAKAGFLPGIQVRGQLFFLATDTLRVKKIMDGLTSHEVAQKLGVTTGTVTRMVRENSLRAVDTPNGLRFDSTGVARFARERQARNQSKDAAWLAPKVREVLDIDQSKLNRWVEAGVIKAEMIAGRRLYDPVAIMQLKAERERIQGDFTWLPRLANEATYSQDQVAQRAGTSSTRVAEWAKDKLLPYYDLTPPTLKRISERHYIASYVDALVDHAKGLEQKLSKAVARSYKQVAQERAQTR